MTRIIGIFGELGTGKTLSATILGFLYYKKGYNVYSNIYISYAKKFKNIDFKNFHIFLENLNPEKNLFIFDELQVYFDSRLSTSKRNRILSYLILQSRKRSLDIIYTSQDPYAVDLRLRTITNNYIYPEIKNKTMTWEIFNSAKELIKIMKIKDIQKYYKLYNTNEIVNIEY